MCSYEELRLLDTDAVSVTCLHALSLSPPHPARAATRPFLWKVGLGESRAGPGRGLRTTGQGILGSQIPAGAGVGSVGGEGQEDGRGHGLQVGTPAWP